MKLFTKDINQKLFNQYTKGSNLANQYVIAKIFNPYGNGRWYLLNSDPEDPDYLWAIVQMGDILETGSVSRKMLESIRLTQFRLPLERDLSFSKVNALELYNGLKAGKFYKKGGWVENNDSGNAEMLRSNAKAISHHAKELQDTAKGKDVEAWVVAKSERAATDLSDVTHYLDGKEYANGGYMKGGGITEREKLEKELHRLQRELNSNRLISYREGDESATELARRKERAEKLERFNYVLKKLNEDGSMGNGGYMAGGGKIKDQYEGREAEDIWNNLSKMQRQHFLYDHASEIENYRGEEYGELKSSEIIKAYNSDYSNLDKNIRNRFENHVRQGQYANGGYMEGGGQADGKNGYIAFYKGKRVEVYADTMYQAQLKAAKLLNAKKSYEVDVALAEIDGKPYVNSTMAKGGMVVTSIKDIPNFKQRLEEGKITYRGLGLGKLAKDFYKLSGTYGTRIKVDGKEYFITDEEFDTFSRDANGKMRIRFDAPYRKFEDGGYMAGGGEIPKVGDDVRGFNHKYGSRIKEIDEEGRRFKIKQSDYWDSKDVWISFDDVVVDEDDDSTWHKRKMANGGKVGFSDKVKAVKQSLLKRKKVSPKVQKDYGKTYSPKEAEDSARRIVGAMTASERLKSVMKKRKK